MTQEERIKRLEDALTQSLELNVKLSERVDVLEGGFIAVAMYFGAIPEASVDPKEVN